MKMLDSGHKNMPVDILFIIFDKIFIKVIKVKANNEFNGS